MFAPIKEPPTVTLVEWETTYARALQPPNPDLGIQGDIGRIFVRTLPLSYRMSYFAAQMSIDPDYAFIPQTNDATSMYIDKDYSFVPTNNDATSVREAEIEVIGFSQKGHINLKRKDGIPITVLPIDNTPDWIESKDFLNTVKKIKEIRIKSEYY